MIRLGPVPLPLCFVYLLCFSSNLTVLGEGPFCSQGGAGPRDMIQNGAMNPKYMWNKRGHKTYVPVVMDHSYTYKEHSIIVGGLHEIQQKTCVEFDIYDNEAEVEESDYVYITKNTKRGCYSYIGRIGGKQEIGLPIGCISHRTAMHEMLHALGFRHEHVRYDRDDYIIVFWGNIRPGRESNFRRRSPSDLVAGPYDYDSIMHYERKAFSVNGMETIRPLKNGAKIGVRQKMSYWDAKKVNMVYKCGGKGGGGGGLSWSPALRHNNIDYNDLNDTLPIAEYDDFNGADQRQTRTTDRNEGPRGNGGFSQISSHLDDDHHHPHPHDEDNGHVNQNNNHHNHNNHNNDHHNDHRHFPASEGGGDGGGGGRNSFHSNHNDDHNGQPFYSQDDNNNDDVLYDF